MERPNTGMWGVFWQRTGSKTSGNSSPDSGISAWAILRKIVSETFANVTELTYQQIGLGEICDSLRL
jgi:hypothetical protein